MEVEILILILIGIIVAFYVQYLIIKAAVLNALKEFDFHKEVKKKELIVSDSDNVQ